MMHNTLITDKAMEGALAALLENGWIERLDTDWIYYYTDFDTVGPLTPSSHTLVYLAYVMWRHGFNVEFAMHPSMHIAMWYYTRGATRPRFTLCGDKAMNVIHKEVVDMRVFVPLNAFRRDTSSMIRDISMLSPTQNTKAEDIFYLGYKPGVSSRGDKALEPVYGIMRNGITTCSSHSNVFELLK